MAKNFEHLIHKNSNVVVEGAPKLPTSSQIEYGELAVNYAKDKETISLRNSNNEIVTFSSDTVILSKTVQKEDLDNTEKVIASALNDINSRINENDDKWENVIIENELVTSAALNELNTRLDALRADFDESDEVAAAALNDLNARIGSGDTNIAQELQQLRDDVDEIDLGTAAALNDLNARIGTLEQDGDDVDYVISMALNDLNSRVGGFESDIQEMDLVVSSSLNDLNARVDDNELEIEDINTILQDFQTRITNVEDNAIGSISLNGEQQTITDGAVNLQFKTINNTSIIGTGNISISGGSGGGGGDVNVIEVVKVNGTALTPDSNKAVDITSIPSSIVTQDSTHRFVSDTEKSTWSGKQDTLTFDGTYNASSNKAATVSTVTNAINALDGGTIGTGGAGKTITALSQTNGNVSATFADISITKSQVSDFPTSMTPSSHTHGNISNTGTLTDTAAAAAGNDYVVIRDADNAKVQTSTIKGTDVADAVSKKHSHSTLTLSTTAQAYDGSHTLALPATDPYTSARTPSAHNQASNTINAMTGYSKGSSSGAVAASDTLNAAISKLENQIDTKTSNTGTITGINMNGSSKGTSGVVDLGTVITSETTLSKGTTTGSGNAVTDISVSGHQITLTKGTTFLTSHQDIKTLNGTALTGTGNITLTGVPAFTSADNGKILGVVNGQLAWVTPTTIYTGTGTPSSSQGVDGDIYLQTS